MKLCVISMSGGLDSTTLAYRALTDGYHVLPINIDYNQKNKVEQDAFQEIFTEMKDIFGSRLMNPVQIDLNTIMKSTLNLYAELRDSGEVGKKTDLEYYTPSRNLLFTTIAAVIGEVAAIAQGVEELRIGLGVHKHLEYKNYWDITPEFVKRVNKVLKLNDSLKVRMYAPYARSTKANIVEDAKRLHVPIFSTWTCYNPQEEILEYDRENSQAFVEYQPCLECEACIERQKAGDKAGVPNINNYVVESYRTLKPSEF